MGFHEKVKQLRTEHKVSQAEIARVLGVAQSVYARYETGERKPSYETLVSLAAYFGVSTDYLLGTSGERRPAESVAAITDDDLPQEAIKELESYKEFLRQKYKKE